jgi:hypothetical protein
MVALIDALLDLGMDLTKAEQTEAAVALDDRIVERFADADSSRLRGRVGLALASKAGLLAMLGDQEAAEDAQLVVVQRFGPETADALRESAQRFSAGDQPRDRMQYVAARLNEVIIRAQLGQNSDATAIFDDLIAHYSSDENEMVASLIDQAREHRAFYDEPDA